MGDTEHSLSSLYTLGGEVPDRVRMLYEQHVICGSLDMLRDLMTVSWDTGSVGRISISGPLRSCLVSFTETEGIEHSIRVPVESLHETAIEAMAAFRRGVFAEMTFGQATQLRVRVRAPEEDTVSVGKVLSWLESGARSPSEVKKNRLKERLRR